MRSRIEWLDFYRGLAVVVMIETHVVNTFLATAHWPVEWRSRLDYVNGLVAPAFLFIAGYAHGLGLRRKRTHTLSRLRRLAGIAAIGYALHFPLGEILAGHWPEALLIGSRMDILPCLAAAIAALVVFERISERWAKSLVAFAMAAVLIAAPRVIDWTGGPIPLVAMVNQTTGSLFPLFPWVAFAFAGFLVAEPAPSRRSLVWSAAGAIGATLVLRRTDLSPVSAAFFFERLAWILLLVPVCGWVSARCRPGLLLYAGRESLAFYVVHLLLISALQGAGMKALGVTATGALFVLILGATAVATWVGRELSLRWNRRAQT